MDTEGIEKAYGTADPLTDLWEWLELTRLLQTRKQDECGSSFVSKCTAILTIACLSSGCFDRLRTNSLVLSLTLGKECVVMRVSIDILYATLASKVSQYASICSYASECFD